VQGGTCTASGAGASRTGASRRQIVTSPVIIKKSKEEVSQFKYLHIIDTAFFSATLVLRQINLHSKMYDCLLGSVIVSVLAIDPRFTGAIDF
jgi:hypothetical protein